MWTIIEYFNHSLAIDDLLRQWSVRQDVLQTIMGKVKVSFSTPIHGWMDVNVSDGRNEVKLDVSDAGCDSLEMLVFAMTRILDGSREESVDWVLEPEYANWVFKHNDECIQLLIYSERACEEPIVFEESDMRIIQRVCKGLSDLEAAGGWDAADSSETVWSWDFPTVDFMKLKNRIPPSSSI